MFDGFFYYFFSNIIGDSNGLCPPNPDHLPGVRSQKPLLKQAMTFLLAEHFFHPFNGMAGGFV